MRLARYLTAAGLPALGIVEGAGIADLTGRLDGLRDMTVLVEGWDRFRSVAESLRGKADLRLDEARLLAPVARPGKIFGVGLNYADHVQETGMATPEHQMWFSMAVTAVNGPYIYLFERVYLQVLAFGSAAYQPVTLNKFQRWGLPPDRLQ